MALNDRLDRLGTFCALTPLADVGAARAELDGWPAGAASPLARVGSTHFARFVILAGLQRADASQPGDTLGGPHLMFSAFFDGPASDYLEALCAALPDEADAVWRHCAGYPGNPRENGHAFRRWLDAHRVPATAIFGAYPQATLPEIRAALDFRRRFRDLAFGLDEQRAMQRRFLAFDQARDAS